MLMSTTRTPTLGGDAACFGVFHATFACSVLSPGLSVARDEMGTATVGSKVCRMGPACISLPVVQAIFAGGNNYVVGQEQSIIDIWDDSTGQLLCCCLPHSVCRHVVNRL